jgi:dephospho-CoA kinase
MAGKRGLAQKCIGIAGPFAAGKGTAARMFSKALGARVFSLADEIRGEAARRGMAPTVANLAAVGNALRARFGPGVLAERAVRRIGRRGNGWVVVDSIRHPAEAGVLARRFGGGFFLVKVSAPLALRFARYRRTPRGGEFASLAGFKAAEERQMRGSGSSQSISRVVAMARYSVSNAGDRAALERKVRALAARLARASCRQ